jgi:F-type H+-transporting ATPase subunit delta
MSHLATLVASAVGKTPEISTRVDPSILGGIKVRVGSRLFDASLRSKLDSLKFALKRA